MDLNNLNSCQTCQCSSSGSVTSVTSSSSRSSNGVPEKQGLRTIHLRRECGIYLEGSGKTGNKLVPNVKPNSFGFSFRGGKEFGTGFFISAVERDSEAQYRGLKVGDQIVRINGLAVDDATHREVLQLAQARHQLTLTVKSVGIIPVKDKSNDPVTWKVVDSGGEPHHIGPFGCDVDRILIEIPENTQLGCGICKGPDWRPGIFVQYTKPNSLARRCGLQPGDQILQCNRISFLQIDFSYAVSVLKNSSTLDLVLKKGSGIDLFPGESSGYSSSSSVADEAITQTPPKSKRLSMVAEEGDQRPGGQRKSCHCKFARNALKSSGSIDSIFDNISNEGSTYREKSKSIEILTTDPNDKKTVTFQNGDHITRTFVNVKSGSEQRLRPGGGHTVIKIGGKDLGQQAPCPSMSMERKPGESLISVEVHRSNEDDCEGNKTTVEKSSSLSSFSSGSSLSSAISKEIQKRNERRLKGITTMTPISSANNNNNNSSSNSTVTNGKQDKPDPGKLANRQHRHQHDLLIAELKKKQGWEEKSAMTPDLRSHQTNGTSQRVPEAEANLTSDKHPLLNGSCLKPIGKICQPQDSPPNCPTPDYFSDASLTDQSIEASHIVKTSILKFEEKNKRNHTSNGVHKTVTFGQNSTKEITPLKNAYRVSSLRSCNGMADKKAQDRVEMQSIDSLDMTEPKKVAPKPPPVYFQAPVRKSLGDVRPNGDTKKRTTVIKITEYPTDKRREPAKFDFLNRNSENNGFDSELASTLLRSNLKNKTDAFANYSNGGTVIKIGSDKAGTGVGTGRFNGFHPMPPVIPTGITETQISTARKSLKTFEKTTSNTVVLKIPKIN